MNGRLMGIIKFSSPMQFCVIRHFVHTHYKSVWVIGQTCIWQKVCTEIFFYPTHLHQCTFYRIFRPSIYALTAFLNFFLLHLKGMTLGKGFDSCYVNTHTHTHKNPGHNSKKVKWSWKNCHTCTVHNQKWLHRKWMGDEFHPVEKLGIAPRESIT